MVRAREFPRAVEFYTQAIALAQNAMPALMLSRAQCSMLCGDTTSAIADADKVMELEKIAFDKELASAQPSRGGGGSGAAKKKYKKNFRALLLKAEALFLAGKFEYAMVR